MLRILLVAAQRAMVDQIVAAVQAAKLEPMGLDLIPFALVRAIGTPDVAMDLEEGGEEAVIDIGSHVTNIVVHARGTTRFVRILPSGGRDITIAIARAAGVEDDVAERLKRGEEVDDMPSPGRSATSRSSAPQPSSTRSDPRSSSTRRKRATRGSARCSSPAAAPSSRG
jgi:type IV pilus assembly protein PilM